MPKHGGACVPDDQRDLGSPVVHGMPSSSRAGGTPRARASLTMVASLGSRMERSRRLISLMSRSQRNSSASWERCRRSSGAGLLKIKLTHYRR